LTTDTDTNTATTKQHPHPDEDAARLRAAIGRLSRRLRPTEAAQAAGLTPTRVSVLLHVERDGPLRISELSESEGINPTMLSRVIADLSEAGLLKRTCDASDRRAAWVEATPAGQRLAERMRTERTDALRAALAHLSDSEQRRLESALPALEALAEALKETRP
jgi:DNA-binding MarR family transcriptional regulator